MFLTTGVPSGSKRYLLGPSRGLAQRQTQKRPDPKVEALASRRARPLEASGCPVKEDPRFQLAPSRAVDAHDIIRPDHL